MRLIPNTPLRITISVALTVLGFTCTVTWVAANGLRDIKEEIASLRMDLHAQKEWAWTRQDMERWTHSLDRANRFSRLEVPQIPKKKQ